MAAEDYPTTTVRPLGNSATPPGVELTLLDYALILWRRKRLVAACTLAGALAALGAHYLLPKKYEATAVILPPSPESGTEMLAARLSGIVGGLPASALGIDNPGERYTDILQTQKVADTIIDRFRLMERFEIDSRVKTRQKLAKLSKFEVTKGGLISITVTDKDPQAAADMANAYVEILGDIDRDIGVGKAGRERAFLDERVTAVEKDMNAAQQAWKAFQEKHRVVAVDEGLKATATVIAELEARRIAKEIEAQVLETVHAKTSPQITILREEIRRLEEKLKEISKHGVRASSSLVSGPSQPGTSAAGAVAEEARNPEPGTADAGASGWLFPAIEDVPALALAQLDIERKLRLQAELYRLLVTQRETARISEARERSTIQIIAAATAADKRAGMGGSIKVMIGLVAGFIFSLTLIWLLEEIAKRAQVVGSS